VSKSALVWRPPNITRSDVSWLAFIARGIVFLVGVAVLIGSALTALPFIWGMAVAFIGLVLAVALIALELPRFWMRLPR
jgi:membrane glycosyltransferase